ncbi:MAG: hypothetical protein LRY27_00150 [Chitinophagales bacterium]|nr:hypothetical protein [Chitinophagales bacterium]
MKKLILVLGVFTLISTLTSCGHVCVRCENGINADKQTECFTDDSESQ